MNNLPIGPALRLLRMHQGLTQTAVGELPGSVRQRSLSHWETGRTMPSLKNVATFLKALHLDFHDLQDALDATAREPAPPTIRIDVLAAKLDTLSQRIVGLERRLSVVERYQTEQPTTRLEEHASIAFRLGGS